MRLSVLARSVVVLLHLSQLSLHQDLVNKYGNKLQASLNFNKDSCQDPSLQPIWQRQIPLMNHSFTIVYKQRSNLSASLRQFLKFKNDRFALVRRYKSFDSHLNSPEKILSTQLQAFRMQKFSSYSIYIDSDHVKSSLDRKPSEKNKTTSWQELNACDSLPRDRTN